MKKLLYIENNASIKATNFYMSAAMAAKKSGIEFHLAYNAYDATAESVKALYDNHGIYFHQIDFIRRPYDPRNIRAYRQVVKLLKTEHFDIIHCNTPIGGVVGRLAGKRCGIKTIIYQAHGFHFYKGAPFLNWVIYYPVEKWLAHYTDVLITINREDFLLAENKMHLRKNGQVMYVPGVGIDTNKFQNICRRSNILRDEKMTELGIPLNSVILISMGDLILRKNYKVAIAAIAKANIPEIQYLICGQGPCMGELKHMTDKLNIQSQIHFLGYRSDVAELLAISDIFILTSVQEGLSRSLMEAMACGLPCIVSRIRGNVDLVQTDDNVELLCEPSSVDNFTKIIRMLVNDTEYRKKEGDSNLLKIQEYDISAVIKEMNRIYNSILSNGKVG